MAATFYVITPRTFEGRTYYRASAFTERGGVCLETVDFTDPADAQAWRSTATEPVYIELGTFFLGKYSLAEGPQHGNGARYFLALGKRGAAYGCLVDPDGRFVWVNLHSRGVGSVPFDLAQVHPLALAIAK